VICKTPKYAHGSYKFSSLEELLQWFGGVRSVSSSDQSRFIFAVAKDGELKLAKYGLHLDIEFDSADYFLANGIAERIGLITPQGAIIEDKEKAVAFAKAFDTRKR
jgi:hypothetical protein